MKDAIKTIPMETPEIKTPGNLDENALQTLALEISKKTTQSVLNTVFSELDRRSNEILQKVERLAKTTEVVVAVKINEDPIKRLKREAHESLGLLLGMLKSGLTPLLVGPAGCGKTLIVEQAAEALEKTFGHLCFSAGVSETWLFGRQTPNGFIEGEFSKLYKEGGLFLADELDAADPNLLLSINTALANGHLYNPISGEKISRHPDFYFVGTANTFGKGGDGAYTGRSRLDAATLDRFTVITMNFLPRIENQLCPNKILRRTLQLLRKSLEKRGIQENISYRAFSKATTLQLLGMNNEEIIKRLTVAWPTDLLEEIYPEVKAALKKEEV